LDWFFRYCGGIPVNRKRGGSLVDKIKKIYEEREQFSLIITPEGTRSANPNWKLGFHHIARAANVPILMVYVDSTSRTVGIEGLFEPTADMHADIKQIKKFYGLQKIKKEIISMRYLDKKTLNFFSIYFDVPKTKFRCYTMKQLFPAHWDY
ncbi:MAG: 1-acyl-sn-glycerol-3-phosphate acyltransferase, partial [Bacteroidetes bacterium]|nr:1-acyl-sn-glycerol-3-phosphate acyltransferase [Bacteroidota bacterium]